MLNFRCPCRWNPSMPNSSSLPHKWMRHNWANLTEFRSYQPWNNVCLHTTINYSANWHRCHNIYWWRSPSRLLLCNTMVMTLLTALSVGVNNFTLYTNYCLKNVTSWQQKPWRRRPSLHKPFQQIERSPPLQYHSFSGSLSIICSSLVYYVRAVWRKLTVLHYFLLHTLSHLNHAFRW